MKETKTTEIDDTPSKEEAREKDKIIVHHWWMRGTSESIHEWEQRPPQKEKDRQSERQTRRWKSTKS